MKDEKGGVYAIINVLSGGRYIGGTVNLKKRKGEHFGLLRSGRHWNKKFQYAWNEFGESAFEFVVVSSCPKEQIVNAEQECIDSYDFSELYNLSPTAGSALGVKLSPESRAKISFGNMGREVSSETRYKISVACSNPSPETRRKMSEAKIGRVVKEESRKKMSASRTGLVPSASTRAKISAAKMGHPVSEEARAKMSATKQENKRRRLAGLE